MVYELSCQLKNVNTVNFDKPTAMRKRRMNSIGELDSSVTGLKSPVDLLADDLSGRATFDIDEVRLSQVGNVSVVLNCSASRKAAVDEAVGLVKCDVLVDEVVVWLETDELSRVL